MNDDNQRKSVDSSSASLVDNMGGSSISNIVTTSGSHLEKRTLPVLYMQAPPSKNLGSSELPKSFSVPKVPVTSVSNGVNGTKTIQAFVGTLINKKCQQKVLLTPVKAGNEKQAGVARVLLQGQRSGAVGQVARIGAVNTTQSTSGSSTSPALSVVLPSQGKPLCTSYVVSPMPSSTVTTPTSNTTISCATSNSSPLIAGTRPTVSIRNAVLIDSPNSNPQNKSAQPNIIRQKIGTDGKISVSSLLKPSGIAGASLLSKVLATPPQHSKISVSPTIVQLKSDSKKEDNKDQSLLNDVVLIEDDDEETETSCSSKMINISSTQDSSTPKQIIGSITANGTKDSAGSTSDSNQEAELIKVPSSPMLDRARKRKGLLATSEPPAKFPKHQDKLKLLPGAEDFDPFKVVEWEPNGIGLLPGSSIKMTVNELGMLTVAEDTLTERGATPATAISDEDEGKSSVKKGNELDAILCCVCCSCYGLPAEFYNASYCSIACRDAVQAQEEAIVKKIEQEQEQSSDNDQRKKRKLSAANDTEGEDKGIKESTDKGKRRMKFGELESDNNTEEESKIPSFMDGVLKQYSKNEEEYNSSLLKAKKIVKKGKLLNSDLKLHKNIKITKHEVKNSAMSGGVGQNSEKNNSIIRPSKTDIKSLTLQANDISKSKQNKSPNKLEINKVRSIVPSKCKLPSQEVSQDLDCGNLTPNRLENSAASETDNFPWSSYLAETGSKPAWVKLFNNPFPTIPNLFQVGYKLEAIDPEHQSNICAVTVVKIKGYRLKLHFDCYSDTFDFWTNVDSPNIFPCGFCSRHGIPLCPPQGHSKETFNWLSYNTIWMATAAPASCFPSYTSSSTSPNLFRVGMKLEAVDRKNTFLVCVATVAGVIENRILVHFDSWGDVYDYWVDTSSPYIRPIGWCKENNHELTPPNGIKATEFSWPEYLAKTKSEAAPTRAFTLRPHYEFRKGMKLEAVDKRAPHLLRVATIKEVLPYQIKIVFDGFPDQFGYWVDDDSPDIHPVGWAAKTGHPLEAPPSINAPSPCPTPGCLGQGHIRSNALETHSSVEDCPYSIDHLNSEPLIPDRLVHFNSGDGSGSPRPFEDEIINLDNEESGEESDDIKKKRWKWLGVREGVKKLRDPPKVLENKKPLQKKLRRRRKRRRCFKINTESKDTSENELKQENWENMEPFKSESNPMNWSTKQVLEFTSSVLGSIESVGQLEKEGTTSSGSSEDNTQEIERKSAEEFSSLESVEHSQPLKKVEMSSSSQEKNISLKKNRIKEDSKYAKTSYSGSKQISKNKRDQFDAFGDYLVEKLRTLDRRSCAFVQKALNDALFEAELGKFREDENQEKRTTLTTLNQTKSSDLQIIDTTVAATTTTFRTTSPLSLFSSWDALYQ